MTRALVVLSGGMDSTTVAYQARDHFGAGNIGLVTCNYGQRHAREIASAIKTAEALRAEHAIIDLRQILPFLKGSALTDSSVDIPEGHYANESMKRTVVPNRNSIMLNIAAGMAIGSGYDQVRAGMHAGDHPIYPDCRPLFIATLNQLIKVANEGFCPPNFEVVTPFLFNSKASIVSAGEHHKVPWEDTWSCYKGGALHCGRCGTCVERREAFSLAGVVDPTMYQLELNIS